MMASIAEERMTITMRPASTAHTLFHLLDCTSVPVMLSPADFLAAIACHPGQLRHRRLPGALDECNRFEPITRSQGSGEPTSRALPRLDFARETCMRQRLAETRRPTPETDRSNSKIHSRMKSSTKLV